MTTTTDTPTAPLPGADQASARRAVVPLAVGSAVVIAFFETMRSDSLGEMLTMIPLGLVAIALVHGVVVPRALRHEAAPARALTMSLLSLVLFLGFWSGLPLVLGGAGALLGLAGRRATRRSGLCVTACVLGVLGVLTYLGVYVADWFAHPDAGLVG